MSYNFLNLSSTEFEQLCHDLLELQIGYDLEIFAEGKDGGIDLRFESDTELVVIQCKRYSQYNDLLQVLKREVSKVEKLKPTKYILVTSVGLNRTRKDVIKNLFSPFIISTGDIYGKDELNALLRKYPEIEKAHFKLWLSSSAIIEKLIHRQQDTEVSFLLEKIQADQKYLVVPESYKRALEILENDNFVIISGVPGIGKSTMARLLCYNYINKGYQPVIVSRNIEEGYKYFQEGINQVILFEDFLGSNFYKQFLSKNEEQRLIRFIENVANNPKKKLILTTREYIFKQAENECEYIQQADLNVSKCQIDLSECSFMFKSQLLYNRLFFSGISVEYINKLLENDRYLEILDHENFNPRTIETLTTPKKIRRILSSQYVDTFIESLNDPKEIWNHAFEKHISSYAKYILYLLLVADSDMFLEEMGASLESLLIEAGEDTSFFNSKYREALSELQDSFISINNYQNDIIIKFQNHSIRDFLLYKLKDDKHMIKLLINSFIFFEQFFFFADVPMDIFGIPVMTKEITSKPIGLDKDLIQLLAENIYKKYRDFQTLKRQHTNNNKIISVLYHMYDFKTRGTIRSLLKHDIQNNAASNSLRSYGFIKVIEDLIMDEEVDALKVIQNVFNGPNDIMDMDLFIGLSKLVPQQFNIFIESINKEQISEIETSIYYEMAEELYDPILDNIVPMILSLEKIEQFFDIETYEYRKELAGCYVLMQLPDNNKLDARIFNNLSLEEIIHGAFKLLECGYSIDSFLLCKTQYPGPFESFLGKYHLEIIEFLNFSIERKWLNDDEIISVALELQIDTNKIITKLVSESPGNTHAPQCDDIIQQTQIDNVNNNTLQDDSFDDSFDNFFDFDIFGHESEVKWRWLSEKNKKKIESMYQSLLEVRS